jgi:hypothetical protein
MAYFTNMTRGMASLSNFPTHILKVVFFQKEIGNKKK